MSEEINKYVPVKPTHSDTHVRDLSEYKYQVTKTQQQLLLSDVYLCYLAEEIKCARSNNETDKEIKLENLYCKEETRLFLDTKRILKIG